MAKEQQQTKISGADFRAAQKSKNLALFLSIIVLCLVLFTVTIIRMF